MLGEGEKNWGAAGAWGQHRSRHYPFSWALCGSCGVGAVRRKKGSVTFCAFLVLAKVGRLFGERGGVSVLLSPEEVSVLEE